MKKFTKKLISCLMCGIMLTAAFTGCGGQSEQSAEQPAAQQQVSDTHTVIDNGGVEVQVPNKIERIVILDIAPLPSVYCMLTGSAEKIVGMAPSSKNAAVHSILIESCPELADVETSFVQGDSVNVEELLALKPDVIFYRIQTESNVQAVSKINVPAVGFSTVMHDGNTTKILNSWVQLLADVMNDPKITERAAEIIKYGEDTETLIRERVSALPAEERTSALVLYNYTDTTLQAANNFGTYYMDVAGANNVASDLTGIFVPINLEQLYAWNPEVIFLNSFSPFSAEDIINGNTVEGDDWSGLTAVKNGRIYKYPIGTYYWFPPSSDAPLSIMWVAKNLYPNLFEDIDMNQMTKDYYSKFYGIELTDNQLESIFNPTAEAAFAK